MAKIVCIDSEQDETASLVRQWRTQNVYPHFKAKGHHTEILAHNLAERLYLKESLSDTDVVYLSGSGHGETNLFKGNTGNSVLKVGEYTENEVNGKIIHLLSCNTAFQLGKDVVKKGCKAFFGYDYPFSFQRPYLDDFLYPTAELDKALSEGKTASEAHAILMEAYDKVLKRLEQNNAPIDVISDMEINREHFCSPVKNARWGDVEAKIRP